MKRMLSGVAAGAIVGVAAGTAAGQAATLEFWPAVREIRADGLRDVAARLPSPVWPAASFPVAEDAVLTPGRYRIEVRYRVIDNIADARIPTGLSSTTLIVSASGPGVVGSRFERGRLTNHAVQDASVLQDDTTGFASGVTGLIGAFRGGLLDDADAGNGGASLGFPTFSVQPLALSSPGHQDPNLALCQIYCRRVWSLLAFDVVYSGVGLMTIRVSTATDQQTGERFQYFERVGGAVSPIPAASTSVRELTFVISPACAGDYNGDGAATIDDVLGFIGDWFTGAGRADANASGVVSVEDVFTFLTAWFAGC